MLVLSRRTNETLVIDNNIRFTVLSVHGNQVRIGIDAPDDIIVLREEIAANTQRMATLSNPSSHTLPNMRDRAKPNFDANNPTMENQYPKSAQIDHHNGEHGRRRGVLGLRRRRP
jgi:carbon storage regulator